MRKKYTRTCSTNARNIPCLCDKCLKHFMAAHPKARFCSSRCRNAALRDKKRKEAREKFRADLAAGKPPTWPAKLADDWYREDRRPK